MFFMKLTLIFTGKTQSGYLKEGIDVYIKRLQRYVPVNIRIIEEPGKKSGNYSTRQKTRDNGKIISGIDKNSFIVLLDEKGKAFSSQGFARFVEKTMIYGYKEIVFVSGGAYGFPDNLHKMANKVISLSWMTFSHQMVRLILVEQLYRAMTIIRGEPYHHE